MVHKDLLHKTDAGAVQLGLTTEQAVLDAIEKISTDVARYHPGLDCNLFLVERNVDPPVAELIVSIRQDAQFGMALTLGSGGILVELLDDVVTLLLPTSTDEIREAIKKLKIFTLMDGYRGQSRIDLHKLCNDVWNITQFVQCNRQTILELEINPLFVYQGETCAVDALAYTPI